MGRGDDVNSCSMCGAGFSGERCPRCGTPAAAVPPTAGTPLDWSAATVVAPTILAPAGDGVGLGLGAGDGAHYAGAPYAGVPYNTGPHAAVAGQWGERPAAPPPARGRGLLLGVAAGVGAITLIGLGAAAMVLLDPGAAPAPTRPAAAGVSPARGTTASTIRSLPPTQGTPAATAPAPGAPAGDVAAPTVADAQPGVGTRQHTVTASAPGSVPAGSSVVVWISAARGGAPTRAHTYPYQVLPAGQSRAVTVQMGDEGPADVGASYLVEACTVSGTALQLTQAYLAALAAHSPAEVEYRKTGIDLTGYAADYTCPSRLTLHRTA